MWWLWTLLDTESFFERYLKREALHVGVVPTNCTVVTCEVVTQIRMSRRGLPSLMSQLDCGATVHPYPLFTSVFI
jgi:hypothetical protein